MRLINATTLEIVEFFGTDTPAYAILSHTWGKDEVTLQEMQLKRRETMTKAGYQKITFTCAQALRDGLQWAWVDTCCIDKTSSAELSEAINSMYRWYSDCAVCYAFLSDFSQLRPAGYTFEQSRWFSRSWTLQELVAPQKLLFYDVNWTCIGNLHDEILLAKISRITGIPAPCLLQLERPYHFSVAKRMSWAANRQCSRIEDIAYSLMGLFDVNMPLLYGEGKRAFIRLQEEILKDNDDQTILAWTVHPEDINAFAPVGVLAESPAYFAFSGDLVNVYKETIPSTMTKLGLSIRLPLTKHIYSPESHLYQGCLARKIEVYDAVLNCGRDSGNLIVIRLLLAQTTQLSRASDGPSRSFYRLGMTRLQYGQTTESSPSDIYIAKNVRLSSEDPPFGFGGIHLQNLPLHALLGGVTGELSGYTAKLVAGLTTPSTSERKVRLFKSYGCIQFSNEDLGYYNDPIHVIFEGAGNPRFFVSIGYAENWIYLEINTDTPSGRPGNDTASKDRFRERCLEGRQSYRDKYGTVAAAQEVIEGRIRVDARLHHEDPNTDEGEAAGNRRHFILFVEAASARLSFLKSESSPNVSAVKGSGSLKQILRSITFPKD